MFLSKGYGGTYYLYYTDPFTGIRKKVSTKAKNKTEANKFLMKYAFGYIKKRFSKDNQIKIKSLEDDFMVFANNNLSPTTISGYKALFRNLLNVFGNFYVKLISYKNLESYKNERLKFISKTSVNVELRMIKSVLNYAKKSGYIEENPMKNIKLFRIEEKEKLCFSNEEIKLILSTPKSEIFHHIIIFALHTGCRLDEIINLQVKDIDLLNKSVIIRNKPNFKTKSGKIRIIPISDELYDLLKSVCVNPYHEINQIKQNEDYLFSRIPRMKLEKGNISKKFKRILREAGLDEKYHFHCLRHTFITSLIKAGVNINYVKELAGHSDIKTTMNYIHINTDDLRDAVNSINLPK